MHEPNYLLLQQNVLEYLFSKLYMQAKCSFDFSQLQAQLNYLTKKIVNWVVKNSLFKQVSNK